ncbi:MATE family efflux transporter [Bacillus sp. AGMB 02131]|uniref:Multidrug export protein MepA n=1 Tax=Peribacillus faecalis TaxID=2772559 RepID=A0A927CWY3_9BACI|nr:MATE family efflux transporter [Peribacillus faecalis]MBD3109277.1 MATE family efflux transporter [Peribacillus faecalis]
MRSQNILGTESVSKLLLKYSIPAMIGMIVNALYNIVDRMFIGHIPDVGPMAITGVGVTMPIMTVIMAFGMLVGIGSAASMSIKLGQGKKKEAEQIIGNATKLLVLIAIGLTIIGLLFLNPLLRSFGATDQTIVFAKDYIEVIIYGIIFNLFAFAFSHMTRADGNPKLAAIVMVAGCAINIILDPIFIFVFDMGIQGAAIATVISQTISALWLLYYFTKGSSALKISLQNTKLNKQIVKAIFAIGIAPCAMQLASSLVQVFANNTLMTYGGDMAIGAMTIINSIALLFLMPIFGINQGSQPIIGFNHGAKQYQRSRRALLYSIAAATVILTIGATLIQLFPAAFVSIFNNDATLTEIAVDGMKIFLFALPILSISVVGPNYFQSIGKARISLFLSLLRQVLLFIPLLFILPRFMGLKGIWFVMPISDTITALITLYFLRREMKRTRGQIPNPKAMEESLAG